MPRTASSIISRAIQKSKTGNVVNGAVSGYTSQALDELNDILDQLCYTLDFSAAMGTWNFTMATALVSSGAGNIVQASPNPLPLDYLRVQTSGGVTGAQRSSTWYLSGVPYPMIELDLTEWDNQVQQAGIQSYPYFWAKDLSQRQLLVSITGDLDTTTTTVANLSSTAGIVAGMSIYGGIGPVSLITPGSTVSSVGATSLVLSTAPSLPNGNAMTQSGASLVIGWPAVGYPYPAPSGAFNTRIRYQRLMPSLTQVQVNAGAYCWFEDSEVLTDLLTERLMGYSDDARSAQFDAFAAGKLAKYTRLADDRSNRAQQVQLDRRSFGQSFSSLRNTKAVGF